MQVMERCAAAVNVTENASHRGDAQTEPSNEPGTPTHCAELQYQWVQPGYAAVTGFPGRVTAPFPLLTMAG
jgi:hypothetical protein